MRFGNLILCLILTLTVACKLLPEGTDQPPPAESAQSGDGALPSADSQNPIVGQRPKPRPSDISKAAVSESSIAGEPAISDPVPQQSIAQKSKEELACEKQGGNWAKAGKSSGRTCLKPTRDAGKQCRKQGDCTSVCLARSGTCAPVKPLFGCNEILQKDGSRVTLCID